MLASASVRLLPRLFSYPLPGIRDRGSSIPPRSVDTTALPDLPLGDPAPQNIALPGGDSPPRDRRARHRRPLSEAHPRPDRDGASPPLPEAAFSSGPRLPSEPVELPSQCRNGASLEQGRREERWRETHFCPAPSSEDPLHALTRTLPRPEPTGPSHRPDDSCHPSCESRCTCICGVVRALRASKCRGHDRGAKRLVRLASSGAWGLSRRG